MVIPNRGENSNSSLDRDSSFEKTRSVLEATLPRSSSWDTAYANTRERFAYAQQTFRLTILIWRSVTYMIGEQEYWKPPFSLVAEGARTLTEKFTHVR